MESEKRRKRDGEKETGFGCLMAEENQSTRDGR